MWSLVTFIILSIDFIHSEPIPKCRFTMKEPRGVITTPNFPDPYPVPINCQWVIEAPSDKVIAVYFTQFYMREGLTATEYAYYSQNVKMGKTEFGTISSDREPTYLVSNKPVLVLDFKVKETANIHMRVREYLLDVFGFNITYEFLSRNESVRKDACLYHHCSFTGNCYASSGYDQYNCSCFSKYFGDECQYDTECGPTATRNMCLNGGTCRYYIGSTVRTCECPPGYDGARCESIKINDPKQIECVGSSCNKTCTEESEDGVANCIEDEKRMRYVITLKLTSPKIHTFYHDRKKTENFKREMEHALFLAFKGRLKLMENITVIDIQLNETAMKFHMLAKPEDAEELNSTVEQMVQVGKLGSFDFDHDFQEIYSEPALRIIRMESSEPMPVSEGSELTLACTVEGSSSLQVQWFKDGHLVRAHTSHRSTWMALVPRTSRQQFTALLGFDRVVSLDSGTFTCQVNDWGFVRNRSIHVRVLSAPQPQLRPLSATVARSSPLVITCLSRDDVRGDFGYTWLKDGRLLGPHSEENAEDLFPAGSRILLKEIENSATYSCIITSQAGSTKKDSVITVIEGDNTRCCQPEDYLRVRWGLTAVNSENIQLCPTGYTGEVRRRCISSSDTHAVEWDEPDFSGCFTSGFLSLKKKVYSLRLGYLISDAAALLSRLKRYLMAKKQRLHFCEGEPIVDLLQEILSIEIEDNSNEEAWATFLDIASVLIESPILIKKFSKLILLNELIFDYGFQYTERTNEVGFVFFERKALAIELGKLPDQQAFLRLPSHKFSAGNKFSDSQLMHNSWMTSTLEVDMNGLALDEKSGDNSSAAFMLVWHKNVSSHFPHRYVLRKGTVDVEYYLISNLVELRLNREKINGKMNVKISFENLNFTVPVRDKDTVWNVTCATADFKAGKIQFSSNKCRLIWHIGNNSICQCEKQGTYALLLTHSSVPKEVHVEVSVDAIAGAGCAICAFLVLLTMLILLSLWKKIRGAIVTLKLQVCVALLGAFGLFFWGFMKPFSEEFFSYTVSFIQFFLLTAFSLQLCLALTVYIESVELRDVQYSFAKISALGWAIPVIIVGATLAAQSLEGYVLQGWWLNLRSNFFYAYTSSTLILTLFQVLLFLIVKSEIRSHGKVADFLQNKKIRKGNNRIKLLNRSLLLTTTLLLMSMASILYVNFHQKIYEYFFAISSVIVGLVVFLSYTFCSEKHFLLCCQEAHDKANEQEDSDMRSHTDSFKSFIKPEIVDDHYSRKMHIDAEKRAERIKRMYSQIEKASLSDSLNPHLNEAADELLSKAQYQHPDSVSEDSHTPIFKTYQHAGITSSSPRHLLQEGDAFCDPLDRGDGYPKMHWRYANHPHITYGSPRSLSKHIKEQPVGAKRPLLMESDVDRQKSCDVPSTEMDVCKAIPSTFITSSTFQPSQTVKADVLGSGVTYSESFNPMDNLEDSCSLKNSCFLQHTDSLETVVHCETAKKPLSEAPLKSISKDTSAPSQSWNMTTV